MLRVIGAVALAAVSVASVAEPLWADDAAAPAKVDLHGDPLPPGAMARLGTVRWRHPRRKFDMAFSADGKELAVTGYDKTIRYYDLDGRPLRTVTIDVQRLNAPQPDSRAMVLSPDGKVAVAEGLAHDETRRKTIYYLKSVELPSGKELVSLSSETPFSDSVGSRIIFLHDSRTVVLWTGEGRVRFWDMIGGAELLDTKPLKGYLSALAASPDGATLALAARRDEGKTDEVDLYLWKWLDEDKPQKLAAGRGARSLAFSPDGKWLTASEVVLEPFDVSGRMAPQGRDVRLYDLATRKPVRDFKADASVYFTSVVFSPDAMLLAAIEQKSRAVIVWDVATGKERRRFETAPHVPQLLAFSPDSRWLAIDSGDGRPISVRSLDTGEARVTKDASPAGYAIQAAFLRGGAVVTADSVGAVRAWEAKSGRPLVGGAARPRIAKSVACARPGGDANSGKLQQTFWTQRHYIGRVGFSRDGKWFFTAGGGARIRATATGDLRFMSDVGAEDADLSSDGRLLAVTAGDEGVQVFPIDLTAPDAKLSARVTELIKQFEHDDYARRQAASRELEQIGMPAEPQLRARIESAIAEVRIRCRIARRQVISPRPIAVVGAGHSLPVAVSFSPDGRLLAAGFRDGGIKVWRVGKFDEVAALRAATK